MFNSLKREDIHKIIDIELSNIFKRVEEMGYTIELTDKAKDFIADKGWDDQFGARPLKRAIQKYVEDALAEELIMNPMGPGSKIFIDLDEETQEIKVQLIPSETKELKPADTQPTDGV